MSQAMYQIMPCSVPPDGLKKNIVQIKCVSVIPKLNMTAGCNYIVKKHSGTLVSPTLERGLDSLLATMSLKKFYIHVRVTI